MLERTKTNLLLTGILKLDQLHNLPVAVILVAVGIRHVNARSDKRHLVFARGPIHIALAVVV